MMFGSTVLEVAIGLLFVYLLLSLLCSAVGEYFEASVNKRAEFLRKGILTKRQTINGQGQELVMTELNPGHPLVQEALPGFQGHHFGFDVPQLEPGDQDYDAFGPDDAYDEDEDNRGNLIAPAEVRVFRP